MPGCEGYARAGGSSNVKRLVSTVALAMLIALALAGVFNAAAPFWEPAGTIGLTTDYAATVRGVEPGGPAARAGIIAGDRVNLAATPFAQRRFVAGAGLAVPIGTTVRFTIDRAGRTHDVELTAVAQSLATPDRWSLFIQCASSLAFVLVGGLLIALRPSRATWGFGLYCLLLLPSATYPARFADVTASLVTTAAYDVMQNLGVVGVLLFALEFPRPFAVKWRTWVQRGLPALFTVLVAMTLYPDIANIVLGIGAGFENLVLQLAFGGVFALAIAMLCDTYRRIATGERERMRWVLLGFGVGLATNYVGSTLIFSTLIVGNPPAWLDTLLVSLNVLLPLTVAHAVIRHRVLDIDFVVGRAIVFGLLTTMLAVLFGLLDWAFGTVLEDVRLSKILQAALSVVFAFAFDRIEEIVVGALEAIFFRKRRAAERRLAGVASALAAAPSERAVEESLTTAVVTALDLTCAALYRPAGDGAFARVNTAGWSDCTTQSLAPADGLVLALGGTDRFVDLEELDWRHNDATGNAPILAVAMHARGTLSGFALYGGHLDGAGIDPDERVLIARVADAAGVAFAHLDAQRLRAELDRLRLRASR
jgi:hypothetical protein